MAGYTQEKYDKFLKSLDSRTDLTEDEKLRKIENFLDTFGHDLKNESEIEYNPEDEERDRSYGRN